MALLGNNKLGLLGNMSPYQQPGAIPFAQDPAMTAIGAGLLGGMGMDGKFDFSAVPQAMAQRGVMQQANLNRAERDADRTRAEERRKQMNEVIRNYSGLSEQDRAFYMANPDKFNPASLKSSAKDNLMNVDGSLYNTETSEWITPPSGIKPPDFDDQAKLRKEFTDAGKTFTAVRDSYDRINAASKTPTGAGDIAMVYSFMKMFDPTSVVREGEFATAENAGGVPDQIRSLYNRAVNGERLTPAVRKQFLEQAGAQYEAALRQLKMIEEQYGGLAQSYGFDPTLIVPDLRAGVAVNPALMEGPSVGAVEDGFEFLGGDPSDPKSWRKVQ